MLFEIRLFEIWQDAHVFPLNTCIISLYELLIQYGSKKVNMHKHKTPSFFLQKYNRLSEKGGDWNALESLVGAHNIQHWILDLFLESLRVGVSISKRPYGQATLDLLFRTIT